MRKKILIGMMIVTILGVAAGGHFFATTSAQDPPKKAEPEQKKNDDLFDVLKQALEGKKDAATIPPPMAPAPANVQLPPPLPSPGGIPAPSGSSLGSERPAPVIAQEPVAPSPGTLPPPTGSLPALPSLPPPAPMPPVGKSTEPPKQAETQAPLPPLPQPTPPPPSRPGNEPLQPGTLQADPPTVPIAPNKIGDDIAKVKDCPWTMHVELSNGQTVVTATVNRKHEFKIVCQSLDLQTGKGTLKATGKVQISGDMISGSCDSLAIPLNEDRLVLEGNATVSIQKVATNVSSDKPASFELKGTTLDLRISELQSRFIQTSMRVERPEAPTIPAPGASPKVNADSKQWSPYGTLKRTSRKRSDTNETPSWNLEDRSGKVLAVLVARDGGSLTQFEGQTISVLGTREQLDGESVLRVTHIALP